MINVKLKTRENIDVQLQPKQGIKIDSSNKYLFDPTLIQGYVDLTKDYSDKAMQSEANAKASEMNAELSAEQAKASEDNAKLSETRAKESELNAKTSENNAKESETKARQEANASAESAYQSQQSALASYEYSQNAEADAQNVQETLDYILVSETKIAQSEKNTKQSELNAKASETKATQEANASAESAYQSQQSALASYQYSSNAEADAQNANESLDKVLESLDKVLISEANAKASENVALSSANTAVAKAQESSNSAKTSKEKADEASQFALECQAIKDSLGSVYVFRGSVNTASELPDNAQVGDVYDAKDTGVNYAWTGTEWDALGVTLDFDLSDYATKEYVNTTEQEIIENYMEADTALQTQITSLSTVVDEEQEKIIGIESKIPTSASSSNLLVTNTDMFNATQDVRSDFAEADSELQIQINGQATVIASKQDKLVSGTNIKTVNGESVLGSGDLEIVGGVSYEDLNEDLTINPAPIEAEWQAFRNEINSTISGYQSQVDSLQAQLNGVTKLKDMYPVGSVYLSTTSTCPLASLISGSSWTQLGTSIITSVNTSVPIKGTGMTLGLSNGSTNHGIIHTPNSGIWASTTAGYGGNVGTAVGGVGHSDVLMGVTTDASKSGIVGTVTRTSISVYIFKRTA